MAVGGRVVRDLGALGQHVGVVVEDGRVGVVAGGRRVGRDVEGGGGGFVAHFLHELTRFGEHVQDARVGVVRVVAAAAVVVVRAGVVVVVVRARVVVIVGLFVSV